MLDSLRALYGRLFLFIGADVLRISGINLYSTPHRYFVDLHVGLFLFFMFIAIPFFVDVFLMDGVISRAVIEFDLLHINPAYLENIVGDQIELYYMLCFSTGCVVTIASALLLYALRGHAIRRIDVLVRQREDEIIGSIKELLGNLLLFVVGFVCVFVVTIHIPDRFWIDRIPGFIVLQVLAIAKLQAHLFFHLGHAVLLLLPYSLHPRRRFNQ